jgi:hypothetical protein
MGIVELLQERGIQEDGGVQIVVWVHRVGEKERFPRSLAAGAPTIAHNPEHEFIRLAACAGA